jgi:preprotein translocase subunit Sec61beta
LSLQLIDGSKIMSRSKKKKESGPMPAASAGLLRFFEEETEGIKIRPELLVVFAIALIVISVLAKAFFPT